jgi:tripeptide aminopeptidase
MIDTARLLETFLSILKVNSYYPNEDLVVDILRPKLERAGVELSSDPHRNLLGYWPGSGAAASAEPILLCAHTDTVQPTPVMQPVVRDGAVHTDGSSVLGADDKAAVAAIVEALEAIAAAGLPHPPAEILLTVGEDIGHVGSKAFDVSLVRSRMAFIPDVDGPVGGIILKGPWTETMKVTFQGRAAHAGTEPENGRNALSMAARAIDGMTLGRIDAETTANVGLLSGGEAANIIAPSAELVVQVRSLDKAKFERHRGELLECCRRGAAAFEGSMAIESMGVADGYGFEPDAPLIRRAESAIRSVGIEPWQSTTCGGSDANELNAKGLPTAVISVGYLDIHTNKESMPLDELERLAEVCGALLLDA